MRPSGEGDLENSRQDFCTLAYGDRCPFSCGGLEGLLFSEASVFVSGVNPLNLRLLLTLTDPLGWLVVARTGLLDRVRARLSRLESDPDPEPSFSSGIESGVGDF